jgi:hypothetical protein
MELAKQRPAARTSRTGKTPALAPITVLAMRSSKNLSRRLEAATKRYGRLGGVTERCQLSRNSVGSILTAASGGNDRAAEFRSFYPTYRSPCGGASAGSAIHRKFCEKGPLAGGFQIS